jgi:hypothetical protein
LAIPANSNVEPLHQREVPGAVKARQRDDAAEDFGNRELHAGVDDAEVVAVSSSGTVVAA